MDTKRKFLVAVALVFGGAAALWAQTKTEETGGSLAALTTEVRQLRLAVEEATKSQTQTQALGVYLSAQQSRMLQVSARLEAVRNELAAATAQARQSAGLLAMFQKEQAQDPDPAGREEANGMIQMFKQQADQAAEAVQNLRKREADFVQALQIEEQRWSDLIGRLEQTIKR